MPVLVQHIGDNSSGSPKIGDFGLVRDRGFDSAVYMSLFLNARAEPGDDISDDPDNPQGYWGETYGFPIGSRLWLLRRRKRTQETLNLLESFTLEALQWMLDDGIAKTITAVPEINGTSRVDLLVQITKADGDKWEKRWDAVIG